MRLKLVLSLAPLVWQLIALPEAPAAPGALKPEPRYSVIATRFARHFPDEHITHEPLDDVISARAWTNFLASIDDDRVYFLASDIAKFKADEASLDDQLEKGDLHFAYDVFEVFRDRVRDRSEFVNKLLAGGPDIEKPETFKWRRKDEPWARNEGEWDEIWRKRVKNEYVQRVVAGEFAAASATNAAGEAKDKDLRSSPADSIRKRIKQFLTAVEDTDSAWVMERYISAFARAYDPHSDYMSATAMEDFEIEMKLSLVGIGALLGPEEGAAKVIRIIPGGPADLDKRLQPGDKIVAVGQGDAPPEDILHLPLRDVVKKIRGPKGTKVVLVVIPASDPAGATIKKIDITRDEVKLEEQAASSTIREIPGADGTPRKFGILTLPTFYADMNFGPGDDSDYKSCTHDVEVILGEMRDKGVDGVVLDLRNNGGGLLSEAVKMTGFFIPSGPVVQVKEGRFSRRVLKDTDSRELYSGALVVIVNRLSASASEILAGALQDYGRAVIVGDSKTHGKGTVQEIIDVGSDPKLGAMRVTNAMYYRVTGASTQKKGVSPDIVIPSVFDCMDFGEEFLPSPLEAPPIEPVAFQKGANLAAVVSQIKEESEKRRSFDPRFASNRKLLDQILAINKADELPLDIAARRKLAESEKEVARLEEESASERGEDAAKTKPAGNDLVLDESLRILSDLSVCWKHEGKPATTKLPLKKSLFERVSDWLRSGS